MTNINMLHNEEDSKQRDQLTQFIVLKKKCFPLS